MAKVTQALCEPDDDDDPRAGELFRLLYDELRRLAAGSPGQMPQATARVHDAWIKIAGNYQQLWANRQDFIAVAAEAMRRILIDRTRRRRRLRDGSSQQRVDLDGLDIAAPATGEEDRILQVNEALNALTATNPQQAELVKLRFFAGLTTAETANLLGMPERTVNRHWAYARAWLYQHIQRRESGAQDG
jgi:RNA polymerase sigma factor (TIGR02999 family)